MDLEMIDPPGEAYAMPDSDRDEVRDDVLARLARSSGIIFLFDPLREFTIGDSFSYPQSRLTRLAQRNVEDGSRDPRLPHYVAICVAKFDEVRVLETARRLNLLTIYPDDEYLFPRVEGDAVEELLHVLSRSSPSGSAELAVLGRDAAVDDVLGDGEQDEDVADVEEDLQRLQQVDDLGGFAPVEVVHEDH